MCAPGDEPPLPMCVIAAFPASFVILSGALCA